jgi:hypothetical protein
VDTKMRELVAPNLPLTWGIPSIDGFDGGLLPTGNYSAFTSLILPAGEERTTDGRLREMLARESCRGACIPEMRWLNLMNTRYLITDKVFDEWISDIAYDTTFEFTLGSGESTTLEVIPPFEADTVYVLCTDAGGCFPAITFIYADGSEEVLDYFLDASPIAYSMAGLRTIKSRTPVSIRIDAPPRGLRARALTLVDSRTGDFQQLTPDPWRRVLSSDIKLHENDNVLPRAFLVSTATFVPDTESGLALMREPAFDPSKAVVISHAGDLVALPSSPTSGGSATITVYEPERVEIQVEAASETYLLLTDAYYPGWVATVNGQHATIERADVMFRAVRVPAGASTVIFEYQPGWWPDVLIAGVAAWLAVLVVLGGLLRTHSRRIHSI